jgi:hypothetical protein
MKRRIFDMKEPLPGTVFYSRGFRRDMPLRVVQYPGTQWETAYPFRACIVDGNGEIVCTSVYTYRYPADAEGDGCDLLWWLMQGNERI